MCYDIADHEGMAGRFPLVRCSHLIGSELELHTVLRKTLRKLLGSVWKIAVIHSSDRYLQSTYYFADSVPSAGSYRSHGTSMISIT